MHKRTDLKWEAQLNIIADKLGHTAKHQIIPKEKYQFSLIPAGKALHDAEHYPKLTEFITFFDATQITLQQAEGTHFGQILTSLDYYTHRFVVQYISKRLPTNTEPYTITAQSHCPMCITAEEYNNHLLTCKANPEQWE
eukprot:5197588-Ditylum_brightwellii.AAC.1